MRDRSDGFPFPGRRAIAWVFLWAELVLAVGAGAEIRRDVEYGQADGVSLKLDANIPDGPGPFPVVILIHGGGWGFGDKAGSNKPGDGADVSPWFGTFTAASCTWFSINYRLAPAHPWPAALEDVQTAIRWAKAHAKEFKGDPNRVVLVGHSAGGHLATLAGVLGAGETAVQGVIGFAPVTDLELDAELRGLSTSLQKLFTLPPQLTPDGRSLLRENSPVNHVKPGLPPFLLLHGDSDKTVALVQTLNFQAKLTAAGVRADLIILPGAPHGLATWAKCDPEYEKKIISWLREVVGK